MPYLILGVGLVVGLFLLIRWYVSASPAAIRKALIWGGGSLIVLLALFFMITGRPQIAMAIIAGLVFFVARGLRAYRQLGRPSARSGPSAGGASTVRTQFLDMALNHDDGTLDGVVIAGRFEGRRLSEMTLEELGGLLAEVGGDQQSVQVLEAFLDRRHGADWRRQYGGGRTGSPPNTGPMTVEEARGILGVGPQATEAEIEAAYREAIKRNHPDAGGSSWLAAKINEARSLLLG